MLYTAITSKYTCVGDTVVPANIRVWFRKVDWLETHKWRIEVSIDANIHGLIDRKSLRDISVTHKFDKDDLVSIIKPIQGKVLYTGYNVLVITGASEECNRLCLHGDGVKLVKGPLQDAVVTEDDPTISKTNTNDGISVPIDSLLMSPHTPTKLQSGLMAEWLRTTLG